MVKCEKENNLRALRTLSDAVKHIFEDDIEYNYDLCQCRYC